MVTLASLTGLHAFVTCSTRFVQKLKLQATNTRRFGNEARVVTILFCFQVSALTHFIMLCVKSGNTGNIPEVLSGVSALYYKEAGKFT